MGHCVQAPFMGSCNITARSGSPVDVSGSPLVKWTLFLIFCFLVSAHLARGAATSDDVLTLSSQHNLTLSCMRKQLKPLPMAVNECWHGCCARSPVAGNADLDWVVARGAVAGPGDPQRVGGAAGDARLQG